MDMVIREKIDAMKSCDDGCVFCLAKCPKCGSTDIRVQYQRSSVYGSYVKCWCDCSKTVVKEYEVLGQKIQDCLYELSLMPELAGELDDAFDEFIELDEGQWATYEMENDTEDKLEFELLGGSEEGKYPSGFKFILTSNDDGTHSIKVWSYDCVMVPLPNN